jgi:hypothetical protein
LDMNCGEKSMDSHLIFMKQKKLKNQRNETIPTCNFILFLALI